MNRRGMALPLVVLVALTLLVATLHLYQAGANVSSQAVRAELRARLTDTLGSAAAEGWWLVDHPGLSPQAEAVAFYRAVRGATRASATLAPDEARALAAAASSGTTRISLGPVRVAVRDVGEANGLRQGLVELRVSGEIVEGRTRVVLTLVQVRQFWLVGAATPRVDSPQERVAQSVEEGA